MGWTGFFTRSIDFDEDVDTTEKTVLTIPLRFEREIYDWEGHIVIANTGSNDVTFVLKAGDLKTGVFYNHATGTVAANESAVIDLDRTLDYVLTVKTSTGTSHVKGHARILVKTCG